MHAAWSASGLLAFIPGETPTLDRALTWVGRQGKEERAMAPVRAFGTRPSDLRVSPDGMRAAVVINALQLNPLASAASRQGQPNSGDDIWVWDIARTTLTRLTFTGQAGFPLWTPDSRRVCYVSDVSVYCQAANVSSQPQPLVTLEGPDYLTGRSSVVPSVTTISPDGTRMLLGARRTSTNSSDIMMTTPVPPPAMRPLIDTPYNEGGAAISPDGRWVAYHSDESGRNEVYVRPFPEVSHERFQISSIGGAEPRWAANGRELFFRTGGGAIPGIVWSVSIEPGAAFVASVPREIVKYPDLGAAYDIAPDGRFLFTVAANHSVATDRTEQIVIVHNWFDDLRARVPIPHR